MKITAIDGSKLLLPNHKSVIETFGEIPYSNDHPEVEGAHAYGQASVLFYILNRIVIDSKLGKARDYEVNLAKDHLTHLTTNDLLLCDRNYASYIFLATLCSKKLKFVIRCSAASFTTARMMIKGIGYDDQTVIIKVPKNKRKYVKENNLPEQIKVRFVRVKLDTCQYEVLVTNLMDTLSFPTQEFKTIYAMRWGIEGLYGVLKNRLNLENFSGKTAESVYQDFYAAIYLTGLELILTADSNEVLAEKETVNPQQVNKAVSFNAIKNEAFNLLCSKLSIYFIIQRLDSLFLTSPTVIRKERKVPRIKGSARYLFNYMKRRSKECF